MELNVLDHRLRIASIQKDKIATFMHSLVGIGLLGKANCKFFSFTATCDDYSLVLDEEGYKVLPQAEGLKTAEGVWVPLNVSAGAYMSTVNALGISQIAKSLIIPLADFGVSIYCVSSYQTDFILIREEDVSRAVQYVSSLNTVNKHSQGETMPLDRVELKGIEPLSPNSLRPITHEYFTLSNKFHITSIDSENLPSIAMNLIDAMFYNVSPCGEEKGQETFFCFTTVDKYITILLDTELFHRFPSNTLYEEDECCRILKIGDLPDGLGFSECGIVAQISDPIAEAMISEFYVSTYYSDHTLVPESALEKTLQLLASRRQVTSQAADSVL